HSMPSSGRLGERRADIVPGSQGRSTAHRAVITTTEKVTADAVYDLAHYSPSRGGYTTQYYGRLALPAHAIQHELTRRLYMDEATLAKTENFERCATYCSQLIAALGKLQLPKQ